MDWTVADMAATFCPGGVVASDDPSDALSCGVHSADPKCSINTGNYAAAHPILDTCSSLLRSFFILLGSALRGYRRIKLPIGSTM